MKNRWNLKTSLKTETPDTDLNEQKETDFTNEAK